MKLIQWLCLIAPAVVCSCSAKHTKHEEPIKLQVTTPLLLDTVINHEYVCQIQAINHIEIRSQERGYLERVFVDEGQNVHKGAAMFQIMPRIYAAEADKSRAEASYAEIEYQNTKSLYEKNIVSKQELALAAAKMNREQAELKLRNAHLGLTLIRAPFNGITDRLMVRRGSLLEEGDLITTLSDNSRLWVYFNMPESEYLDFATNHKGDTARKVKLLLANNHTYEFEGDFKTVEADFNNETGNIAFRATFPNPNGLLRHGQTGTILLPSKMDGVLLIPQAATFDILDKKFVFVVSEGGVVQTRAIEVGLELPHVFAIKRGLKATDKILIEGQRKVSNNDKITPVYRPVRQVLAELNDLQKEQ